MSTGLNRIMALAVIALSLVLTGQVTAEVYKVVDADGNVVYTDRPPDGQAQPMDLPGLSVVEAVRAPPRQSAGDDEPGGEDEVTSIRELRRAYRDFAIVNPRPEETIWGAAGEVTIAWDTRYQLQPSMRVIMYLDDEARAPTTNEVITVSRLNRGAHTVRAELVDGRNRRIATAEPVTFYVQQYSVNYGANRNRGN